MNGRLSQPLTLRGQLTSADTLSGVLTAQQTITGKMTALAQMSGKLTPQVTMRGKMTIPPITGGSPYTGSYEFTPTNEEQVIPILGMVAMKNITINPIPSNYGLITWNGSVLTVS